MALGFSDLIGIALRLAPQRGNIEEFMALIEPVWSELMPKLPRLAELGREILAAADPDLQQQLGSGAKLISFDSKALQAALNKLGTQPPLQVDGVYGKATQDAVTKYQIAHSIVPHGWADVHTCLTILEELDKENRK